MQDAFISYMDNLIEHNKDLDSPVYCPSHLESLKEKPDYFEVSALETKYEIMKTLNTGYDKINYK